MAFTFSLEENRYVVRDDSGNEAGEVTWSNAGDAIMIIDHTFVDPKYRGNQLAQQLVKHAADKARAEGKKVIPLCPFAKKEFQEKAEYADIWRK